MGSQNSSRPSATFAGVVGLSDGAGATSGSGENIDRSPRSACAPSLTPRAQTPVTNGMARSLRRIVVHRAPGILCTLERLAAIEIMRRVLYGRAAADRRLQRVL